MPPSRRPAFAPLLAAAVTAVGALILLYLLAVHTREGQRLDDAARGDIGPEGTPGAFRATSELLDTISVSSLAVFGLLIMGVAIVRARPRLALGAGALVLGANLTTQVLKRGLERPDLGEPTFGDPGSFPSGHTTVAMSLAMALVLVAPPALRWLAALAGGAYAVGVGVAVVALSWHRPSDAVGAYLVVIAWTALVVAALASPLGDGELGDRRRRTSARARALGTAGAVALTAIFAGLVAVTAARRIDLLRLASDRTAFVAAAVVCAAAGAALTVAMTGLLQRTPPAAGRAPARRPRRR